MKITKIVLAAVAISTYCPQSGRAHSGFEHAGDRIKLSTLSSYKAGPFGSGAAEIVTYDPATARAFVTNSYSNAIDAISLTKPSAPALDFSIDMKPYGSANSVAVKNGLLAVAVQADLKQENGSVIVFNTAGKHLNTFGVGALPDMVTFSPDGKHILVANEGEPSDDYAIDPEGSITLIEVDADITKLNQDNVRTVNFNAFDGKKIDPRIRIFGKNASVSQDLEPEYITVSEDSKIAWVSLQENNALAEINIESAEVQKLIALGTQSHNNVETAIDASDRDKGINIKAWPVEGMYQPDSIASYRHNGNNYIVTANEGDARDYKGYSEEIRIAKMTISDALLESNPTLKDNAALGRLKVSKVGADADGDGKVDKLYSFGTRSFSIWDESGNRVYDSGAQFARILARDYPKLYNKGDNRSCDKGPEPEALALGTVGKSTYAFIGLERLGGVMVYNITDPKNVFYVDYLNNISPDLAPNDPRAGDMAPESIVFVSVDDSPNRKPFIITANEASGTVSVYEVEAAEAKRH